MIRDIAVAAVLSVILVGVVIVWATNRRRWEIAWRKRKTRNDPVLEDTAVDPDEEFWKRKRRDF